MNAIGNRHIANNLRILIINNGLGDEFRIYDNPTHFLGEEVRPYIAAEGHFGLQSPMLIKSYAESLGFEYMIANDKASFLQHMSEFTSIEMNQSIIFEVMIKPEDDTDALDAIKHIRRKQDKPSFKKKLKSMIKDKIGSEKLEAIRTILK
jgi:2-succinyl-5-enolpyruvyl-6-hydroxy-3-cyclohexene-1-carboxylate synthase